MYERGETYTHFVTVRNYDSTAKENPDTIKITITAPDDVVLVNAASMTSDGTTGEYYYNYAIPADALYGEYIVEVDSTKDSSVTTEKTHFVIFSWDVVRKIRQYSGVGKESVGDDDVAGIALEAFRETVDEIYEYHFKESPMIDPDYGVLFNGSNTVVRTKYGDIADHDFDGYVYGTGNLSRNTDWLDITGYWIDSDYAKHDAKITVNDSITGRITVTQNDSSAIPNDHNGVYMTYWTEWSTYNKRLMKDAIAYLSAHHLLLRMMEAHRATAADLPSNQRKIEMNMNRFQDKYYQILEKIAKPIAEGVR